MLTERYLCDLWKVQHDDAKNKHIFLYRRIKMLTERYLCYLWKV